VAVETEARVVIIGAGVVGCAVAEHLGELGWGDPLPIDQGPQADRQHRGGLDFVGRQSLLQRRETPRHRLCCVVIDGGWVVMGKEPVFAGGEPAGFVTSAAFGCSIGKSTVYAWLSTELGSLGTQVDVQYVGERHPATVAADPLFDPEMRRMRS
jgi:glycine cleavage system aminomethyltransferase T